MQRQVEFYYDYGSPTAYLAWTQLPDICRRCDAELICRPVLLGGVFKATGNETPARIEAKRKWMFDDIVRYAESYGVPFAYNPHFIFVTLAAMRGAVWADSAGCLEAYNRTLFEAAWVEQRDVGNAEAVGVVLKDAGLDADAALHAIQQPEIKTRLIENTNGAVDRGVFGVPTVFVAGQMHFGQDRLPWVKKALAR